MLYSAIISGDPEPFKNRVLKYICAFDNYAMLDSNSGVSGEIPYTGSRYNYIAASGVLDAISVNTGCLENLEKFITRYKNSGHWIFGYISYDLKNEIEDLVSENPVASGFPVIHFFVPRHTIIASPERITVLSDKPDNITWNEILKVPDSGNDNAFPEPVQITHIPNREEYLAAVDELTGHIRYGNIYEVNYCHQLLASSDAPDAAVLFRKLNTLSPNPFSCLYRTGNNFLFSASPERFLAKRENELISQPVKGTGSRSKDPETDLRNKAQLQNSEKERSENIMIADLVRNDLSKVALKGTVRAQELCEAYTYSRVHQLVSTITCGIGNTTSFTEIIRALFPMGSMTGAPKISAMKLIEQQESFRRSLFSGAVGYISPEGDFDFNVVIRSILFNAATKVISVAAGGALTAASEPQREFEETLLKMTPQLEALGISRELLSKELLHEKPA